MLNHQVKARIENFCHSVGIDIPILLAPMAGACPTLLSAEIAKAGGMGACGALLLEPQSIFNWADDFHSKVGKAAPYQINLWIPDPDPSRDPHNETFMREFLNGWGPTLSNQDGESTSPNFNAQCETILETAPTAVSSIMGLYPEVFVKKLKQKNIKWFATVTTVHEAQLAELAGADVLVAQGSEAGGHRGSFFAENAIQQSIGLFSLLPAIVDAVNLPVVATGGIADARGACAAFMLGASAVQIGTGYLRCPESNIPSSWSDAIANTNPEQTRLTRAFSGRTGRSIATEYIMDMEKSNAPSAAPYPIQRSLTQKMRTLGVKNNDISRIQAWAGQSAKLAQSLPAAQLTKSIWLEIQSNLNL